MIARLHTGAQLPAQLIASDSERDLAVLQIAHEGLQALRLGRSRELEVGEEVVVIGFPEPGVLGCEGSTMTRGNIARLGVATQIGGRSYQGLMLIDARARPGSSGSPVLNLDGEVVGIVVGGFVTAPFFGFAIPIDQASERLCAWDEEGRLSPEVRRFQEEPVPLYQDDFSDPASGWLLWPLPAPIPQPFSLPFSAQYEEGRYVITVGRSWTYVPAVLLNTEIPPLQLLGLLTQVLGCWCGEVRPLLSPTAFARDFRARVRARQAAGPPGEYGLIFRFQGIWEDRFYRFTVSTDGAYQLAKRMNRSWEVLIPWTTSPALKRNEEWNLLEVEAVGSEIRLFANGELLATVREETFLEGYVALTAGSFEEAGARLEFDDFELLRVRRLCSGEGAVVGWLMKKGFFCKKEG